ncbi:hypothetical protein BJ508DRAFT_49962 [Ascobolus immersus RN42]|uniref:Uncharacterized protein n=1 Tax=Ascobolus immersus RN42 TaxID=1160509 RepID=A0A3N4HHD7_ASCIM|nr:hypothetical protein BJ508DRAFT_49962 [Ascobolus immersus RN42]
MTEPRTYSSVSANDNARQLNGDEVRNANNNHEIQAHGPFHITNLTINNFAGFGLPYPFMPAHDVHRRQSVPTSVDTGRPGATTPPHSFPNAFHYGHTPYFPVQLADYLSMLHGAASPRAPSPRIAQRAPSRAPSPKLSSSRASSPRVPCPRVPPSRASSPKLPSSRAPSPMITSLLALHQQQEAQQTQPGPATAPSVGPNPSSPNRNLPPSIIPETYEGNAQPQPSPLPQSISDQDQTHSPNSTFWEGICWLFGEFWSSCLRRDPMKAGDDAGRISNG